MKKTKDQMVAALRVMQAEQIQLVEDSWPETTTSDPVTGTPELPTDPVPEPEPEPEPVPVPPVAQDPAKGYDWLDSWENDKSEGGAYSVHSGRNGTPYLDTWDRVSFYSPGRHGSRAVRLTTLPGDMNHGSGDFERCDLKMGVERSGGQKGKKFWYANSVMFPENWVELPDFKTKPGAYQSVFSWHWDGSTGQGNVNVNVKNWGGISPTGQRENNRPHFHTNIYGGATPGVSGEMTKQIMGGHEPVRGQWYDFLWYIEWGSAAGRVKIWCRWGDSTVYKRQIDHVGPTLFRKSDTEDYGAYIKVNNYHAGNTGKESSMIHDRIVRGPTMESVALFPVDQP